MRELPAAFDWSTCKYLMIFIAAVTSVRTISKCASGYAVAAAEAVEANNYITTKEK